MFADSTFQPISGSSCGCCSAGFRRKLDRERTQTRPAWNPSRRYLLAGLIAGVAVSRPIRAFAQSTLTPDAAFAQLVAGNQRFVDKRLTSFDEDLTILKQNAAPKQEPFAAVLSCADSRVPVELIFDQSIGHVFVTRVAGNLATNDVIASLEYGAVVLGTKVIVVLAHSNCGAVQAALAGKSVPGQISGLYPYLRAAVDRAHSDADAVAKANAQIQANLLATASPALAELIAKGEMKVIAAYYDVLTGQVARLD